MYSQYSEESLKHLRHYARGYTYGILPSDTFCHIVDSAAALAPWLRDDEAGPGGWKAQSQHRATDSEFFEANPTKKFRLVSASGYDRSRSHLWLPHPGEMGVRLSRAIGSFGYEYPRFLVIDTQISSYDELNAASDARLDRIWRRYCNWGEEPLQSGGYRRINRAGPIQ